MAKQETLPEPIDEVDAEIKAIMGPTPEEAKPVLAHYDDNKRPDEPSGPPEVTDEVPVAVKASDVSEAAEEINKQLEEQNNTVSAEANDAKKEESDTESDADDPVVDAAVADIVAKEGDEILAAEDAKKEAQIQPIKKKGGIRHFFSSWWHNKKARNLTLLVLVAIFAALAIIPVTRYAILNALGVRASLSLQVVDSKYALPVKNAEVSAGGQTGITNNEGFATLTGVKLGKTQLVITKRSFATVEQSITVGWGSNPFNDPIQMTSTGSGYSFLVTDWLSGKPIAKAEVTDGESTALTDDSGKATLTIQPTDEDIELSIKATDYRTEKITIGIKETGEKAVKLIAGKPDVFVSKRSGKYDLYKRDVDGTNEAVLLAGTGSEQDPLGLLVKQDGITAAFVSTRDGKRDSNGFLLSNLYMVDVPAKTATKVPDTESAQIQLIDWVGDKLVFVKVSAGPSAATAGRQRILVYDSKQDKTSEIANANYFNDVEVYNGQIYFAPASGGGSGSAAAQLLRVNPDGSAKTVLLDKEVWATYRTAYPTIQISAVANKWYEQTLGENKVNALSGVPANPTHRIYINSPNGEKTTYIDSRDGKGVLIVQDLKTPSNPDVVVVSKGGLGYPVRWLSDKHILYRVSNSQETVDYIINIEGGDSQKVGDVTNTATTNRWYYYR